MAQAADTSAFTEAIVPKLEAEIALSLNRLTFLLGIYPGELEEIISQASTTPNLEILPDTGLPRNLLRRRPDIRMQERLLAAQTARIGVAKAELCPRFDLQGYLGTSTIRAGDILDSASRTWLLGFPISWNIFSGGRLGACVAQEEARTETALLAYQETVLSAMTEVEGAVSSGMKLMEYRKAPDKALAETKVAADVVAVQYENGVVDFQRVLDVDRNLLTMEDDKAILNGVLTKTLIRLYQALGGGWSPENDPLMETEESEQISIS